MGATDAGARLIHDGLVLTFFSNRAGSDDLYASTRASVDAPFSPPREVAGVNTDGAEQDPWLSDDLCYLAFSKQDELGVLRIYESQCVP